MPKTKKAQILEQNDHKQKATYMRVSEAQRVALISIIDGYQCKTIKEAAEQVGVNYSRATAIYREHCKSHQAPSALALSDIKQSSTDDDVKFTPKPS